jgi:pimeloyl-ACP methyl ester carboxylesterase
MKFVKRILISLLAIFLLLSLLIFIFRTPDMPLEELLPVYASESSQFYKIQGMQIHYRDEGPGADKLPLVLLHGTGSSLHTWDSLVLQMPEKRIIRLDLPGFGLTGPHPLRNYSAENTVKIIDDLLEYLQIDSCIIAGNSLGGFIAWAYALDHPRARKMILIDAAGFRSNSGGKNLGFQLARMPLVNQLVKVVTPRSLVRKSLEQSYGDPAKVSETLVDRYYAMNCRAGNRQAMIDRMRLPFSGDTTRLSQLQIPVLILWGQKDQLIPVSQAEKFASILPFNQKIIFPALGHVPMEEAPGEIAGSIRNWLMQ